MEPWLQNDDNLSIVWLWMCNVKMRQNQTNIAQVKNRMGSSLVMAETKLKAFVRKKISVYCTGLRQSHMILVYYTCICICCAVCEMPNEYYYDICYLCSFFKSYIYIRSVYSKTELVRLFLHVIRFVSSDFISPSRTFWYLGRLLSHVSCFKISGV